ncbi:hypothetical protein T484DRAFT_1753938 [Baffinella frigidus]|nr:hypothetical protein T484DRAFT_1753938 [Cryptophyta sp. CCMP2293]
MCDEGVGGVFPLKKKQAAEKALKAKQAAEKALKAKQDGEKAVKPPTEPLPRTSASSQPLPRISAPTEPLPRISAPTDPLPRISASSQPLPRVGEPANENPIDRRVRILENRVTNFVQDSNQKAARENKETFEYPQHFNRYSRRTVEPTGRGMDRFRCLSHCD